jgi:hypothetical protein
MGVSPWVPELDNGGGASTAASGAGLLLRKSKSAIGVLHD